MAENLHLFRFSVCTQPYQYVNLVASSNLALTCHTAHRHS